MEIAVIACKFYLLGLLILGGLASLLSVFFGLILSIFAKHGMSDNVQ